MTDDNKDIFGKQEIKEEKPKFSKPAPFESKKLKKGIVANITPARITIDFNGNGESIAFDASKHANLKIGDPIEF